MQRSLSRLFIVYTLGSRGNKWRRQKCFIVHPTERRLLWYGHLFPFFSLFILETINIRVAEGNMVRAGL